MAMTAETAVETTTIKYPDCKFEDFADPFLNAASETYNLIMDEIRELAGGDENEIDRITSLIPNFIEQRYEYKPTNSQTEGSKSQIPLDRFTKINDKHRKGYLELILSSALSHCVMCMVDFEDGDLPDAIENFTCASLNLGIAQGINSSENRNKFQKSVIQMMAANARHTENRAIKRDVLNFYAANIDKFTSKDQAAESIAGKIAPVTFRTVRKYIDEYHKQKTVS